LGGLVSIASLAGAVADAVSPVGLSAEAANVVGGAGELSLGNAGHVVNAEVGAVTAGHGDVLGQSNTSKGGSEDSVGLHLDCRWEECLCGRDGYWSRILGIEVGVESR
jgi:hypothetical protein